MSKPWRNWYHVMGNTYGTWLPGDGKGFRTRHHREHVEGDYKKPPPAGTYDKRLEASRRLLKHPPVELTIQQRTIACQAMVERLLREKVEVLDWVVTAKHFHGLARFTAWVESETVESPGMAMPGLSTGDVTDDTQTLVSAHHGPLRRRPVQIDPAPRRCVGLAKKHSSHILREHGLGAPGGVWAVRCKVLPIEDRAHQVRVFHYVRDHVEEGGVLYSKILEQMKLEEAAKQTDATPPAQ